MSSPTIGPVGERREVVVDAMGREIFTAEGVHEATASYDGGRRSVPLVHIEAALDRLVIGGRVEPAGAGSYLVPPA